MTKSAPKTLLHLPYPWPVVWGCFYVAILTIGLLSPSSSSLTFIKLTGIFLCALYAFWMFPKDHLLQLAFLVTSIADLILAIDNTLVLGVVVFLIAQLIHLARLDWPHFRLPILIFSLIAATIIILDMIFDFAPLMYVVCAFYITVLTTNIIVSWRWYRQDRNNLLAFLALTGFTLFLACDICTGVSYLSRTAVLPAFLFEPANFFAWAFYYPSQIFVSNSSKCVKILTKGR